MAPLSRHRRRPPAPGSPAADAAALLAAVRWDEASCAAAPSEFAARYGLPQLARVAKGHYLGLLGVPTLSSPAVSQVVLVSSAGRQLRVSAQCVKFKDAGRGKCRARGCVAVGPARLAIPDTYAGWFEVLSEEGRAAKVIDSVAELARRAPDSCLVREPCKVYVGGTKGGGGGGGGDASGGESLTDRTRTLPAGSTLVLVGEVVLGSSSVTGGGAGAGGSVVQHLQHVARGSAHHAHHHQSSSSSKSSPSSSRFLRCFDPDGESVYLGFEQKIKVSAIVPPSANGGSGAGSSANNGGGGVANSNTDSDLMCDVGAGVYRMSQVVRMRFPLTVRLVHGHPPCCGAPTPKWFVPEMRLLSTFEEECLVALPLLKDPPHLVALPLNAPLKLQGPKNGEHVTQLKETSRMAERSRQLLNDARDKIQVFDISLSKQLVLHPRNNNNQHQLHNSRQLHHNNGGGNNNNNRIIGGGNNMIGGKTATTTAVGLERRRLVMQTRVVVSKQASVSDGYPWSSSALVPNTVPSSSSVVQQQQQQQSSSLKPIPDDDLVHDHQPYDEIDQIYDYVRGFAPPPPPPVVLLRSNPPPVIMPPVMMPPPNISVTDNPLSLVPPVPPPIETIPARRHSVPTPPRRPIIDEAALLHHQGPAGPAGPPPVLLPRPPVHRFVKSPAQLRLQQQRLLRNSSSGSSSKQQQKQQQQSENSSSNSNKKPSAAATAGATASVETVKETSSPLFHIRYKSLSNLLSSSLSSSGGGGCPPPPTLAPPQVSSSSSSGGCPPPPLPATDTLGSSNSGGSGGSAPKEKKSRPRIYRPRSLNNLLFDLQQQQQPQQLQHQHLQQQPVSSSNHHHHNLHHNLHHNHKPRLGTLYL